MAGIGFELRKHLRRDSYFDFVTAYFLAGIIGSGPWIISIGSMLVIGFLSKSIVGATDVVTQFLGTVTQLMATSLIFSGFLQLMFTRFVADRVFEKREESVIPNLFGALILTTLVSGSLATIFALRTFGGNALFGVFVVTAFVTLSDLWILTVVLSGMKGYRSIVVIFLVGYTLTVVASLALARFGAAGYLAGFSLGHGVMLFSMLVLIVREYPGDRLLAFEFLSRKKVFFDLALAGVTFNAAIWADKFMFWLNPVTSDPLIGPIRYSVVYDVPIFVAYLSVLPGMAVFLVRIETDFAETYGHFFTAVREGAKLVELRRLRNGLVNAARAGIYDMFQVQGLAVATLLLIAPSVLALFGIPQFYLYLFRVDVVAVGFQVILLGTFTILFYLDYRKLVLYLCVFFLFANIALSALSLRLGPRFYGLGYAVAAGLTGLLAMAFLSRKLDRLEYETFMR